MSAPPKLRVSASKRCDTCIHADHDTNGTVYDCRQYPDRGKAPKSFHVCDSWGKYSID